MTFIGILRAAVFVATSIIMIPIFMLPIAHAGMQVAPLVIEMENAPGQSSAIRVRNTSAGEIPVEVSVVRREVGPSGNTINVPADADFVIFPPQTVIPGQQTQVFRFQYLGGAGAEKSASYYIYASQLPVFLGAEESVQNSSVRINFLYEYGVSVHMVPPGAEPGLEVTNASPVKLEGGAPGVRLTITNEGNRFARASEHELVIETETWTTTFDSAALKTGLNNGMWLPGQTFEINFPVQEKAAGRIDASFEFVGEQ